AFRAAFRTTPDYRPEPIDYLALVGDIQGSGVHPVYPATLPHGWFVKDTQYTPGDRPSLDLAIATDKGLFAGVHDEDASVGDLVSRLVDENAVSGPDVKIPGSIAPTWQSFSDSGGDHAYAAQVGRDTVLVYGSASAADLRVLVASLTRDPVGR
ncbi:MAG: DUF4245 family protein, partial [Nocardioides sp.]